jgi:hypothetical protein
MILAGEIKEQDTIKIDVDNDGIKLSKTKAL